jgi:hypothetical protein
MLMRLFRWFGGFFTGFRSHGHLEVNQNMNNHADLRVSLAEVERYFELQVSSVTSYKETIKYIFGFASLIITVLGSLQLITGKVSAAWLMTYQVLLGAAFFLYILLLLLSIFYLVPTTLKSPIDPTWDELEKSFFYKEEKELLVQQICNTLNVITLNKKEIARLSFRTRIAVWLVVIIILLLAILILLPKI